MAIKHFIKNQKDLILIFSSSRHLAFFNKIHNHKYICLVGNENERLSASSKELNNSNLVIPPSPREIGTFIPEGFNDLTFELDNIGFTDKKIASHCSVSLQTAMTLGLKSVYIVGFDGYIIQNKGSNKREVFNENEIIFQDAQNSGLQITSLTPTLYSNIYTQSIYSLIK